jgi:cysteine synthase A
VSSVLDAIGNTPLVRLRRLAPANGAELWLKLEYRNPSGSMKDRMALAMIEGAERDGLIAPGDTIVEFTGGSTGPALALVCTAKGYRPLIVMADCFTEERFQLTRALGGDVDVVPSVEGRPKVTPKDIENMVARAAELAERPGHYWTDLRHDGPSLARRGHLRGHLDRRERRRRASPRRAPRPGRGDRDAGGRQRLQVHERPTVRGAHVTAAR